jgi:cytoskeletal protein RodZ
VLKALEEDKVESAFGATYAKIFLKEYANYLGLDVKEIIRQYTSESTSLVNEKPILEHKPVLQKKEKGDKKFSRAIIITLVFIVWVFILGVVAVKFINHYKYAMKNRKEAVVSQQPRLEKVLTQKAELKEEVAEKKEKSLPITEAKEEIIPIPQGNIITLALISDKDVWLKITQDGKLAFHGILSRNSKETWQAKREIRLSEIGRPEALKLNINGKDIDLAGKRLNKNVLITHKGIELEPK